jgi:hypothetical protein
MEHVMETKRQTMDANDYGIEKHRHNFGVWTAARAVQRGFAGAKFSTIKKAIEAAGIQSYLQDTKNLPTTKNAFEKVHRKWCDSIRRSIGKDASYGRAAKIVAIYLKTTVVIPEQENRGFIRVIHPPIDSILLNGIADEKFEQHKINVKEFRRIRWTKLDKRKYFKLIQKLRQLNDDRPFWMLETFWRPGVNNSADE